MQIQDFELGGAHLKKLRRAEGCAKMFVVFRVKNHDFTPKNHIFPNFSEGARRVRIPRGSAPELSCSHVLRTFCFSCYKPGDKSNEMPNIKYKINKKKIKCI